MKVLGAALFALCMMTGVALADTTGGLRGYVYDDPWSSNPAPLSDALITIVAPQAVARTHTDDRGFFVVLSLPPGHYTISAQKPGHAPRSILRCISAGFTENVTLYLPSRLIDVTRLTRWDWSYPRANPSRFEDAYNFVEDDPC